MRLAFRKGGSLAAPGLILCATDLREGADPAIIEAGSWAKRHGASVAYIHVLPGPSQTGGSPLRDMEAEPFSNRPGSMRLAAEAVVGRVEVLTSRRTMPETVHIGEGAAAATITAVAGGMKADLIVIGANSVGDMTGPPGSVALDVVRGALCPVLVVRSKSQAGPILSASDLSDPAYPAIAAGALLARSMLAEFSVIHIVETSQSAHGQGAAPESRSALTQERIQVLRQAARDSLVFAMTKLGSTGQAIVAEGPIAQLVAGAARSRGARVLVIGAEGRTELRRTGEAHIGEQILRSAPCSVLVVRLRMHTHM